MTTATTSIIDDCYQLLAKTNSNVVKEILRQSGKFYEWNHYPEGDVYDKETHAQYYYHAHAKEDGTRWEEHGHFHLFLRLKGIPEKHQPKPLTPIQHGVNTDDLCHIGAISMDKFGKPIRLFTTNRWVTGETWYGADDVNNLLQYFMITHAWPSWPTNIWLSKMVETYQQEIRALMIQRDQVIENWQRKHPDHNVYEDRNLEITSFITI